MQEPSLLRGPTALDLLKERELGPTFRSVGLRERRQQELSSTVAWNPSRLRHMGLEVPADTLMHGGCINTAAWIGEGDRTLITSGDDRTIKVWDLLSVTENKNNDDNNDDNETIVPKHTISTGHIGNVFHVTAVPHKDAILSCAADGSLRLNYYHGRASDIIVGNHHSQDDYYYDEDHGMCFSHCHLTESTGLLCGELGLRRFDLRSRSSEEIHWRGGGQQPPQQQQQSPQQRTTRRRREVPCKAVALWNKGGVDSHYVFAGGASGSVLLFDLRMDCRTVQTYCPTNLRHNALVSVSGLDLTRDGRELLVSYENDQIYTFPVFPNVSPSGPTLADLHTNYDPTMGPLPELAAYGGHLNRYTFLKSARYAGPNDEYVCTGCDSGHAWIYSRETGEVTALLNADRSTCNGVVPHPTLPFFVTYGIDSTAKLWRAAGSFLPQNTTKYEKSAVVSHWQHVRHRTRDGRYYPDAVPAPFRHSDNCTIGNAWDQIPKVLQRNFYVSSIPAEEPPVQSGSQGLARRVATMRLAHQATRLNMEWDRQAPWIMSPKHPNSYAHGHAHGHPCDMVPEYPSDWIPYDTDMTTPSFPCGVMVHQNKQRYAEHIRHTKALRNCRRRRPHRQHPLPVLTTTLTPSTILPETDTFNNKPLQQDTSSNNVHSTTTKTITTCMTNHNNSPIPPSPQLQSQTQNIQVGNSMATTTPTPHTTKTIVTPNTASTTRTITTTTIDDRPMNNPMHSPSRDQDCVISYSSPQKQDSCQGHATATTTATERETTNNGTTNHSMEDDDSDSDSDDFDEDDDDDDDDDSDDEDEDDDEDSNDEKIPHPTDQAWDILRQTVLLLKEGGNAAKQANQVPLAARRYDVALRYCAVSQLVWNSTDEEWTTLMASIRLNLCLALLAMQDNTGAADQARWALQELSTSSERTLRAKAYYRLGTAQSAQHDYARAIQSFESSLREFDCMASSDGERQRSKPTPDPLLMRRLAEAKRNHAVAIKRQRKKFKSMFESSTSTTSVTSTPQETDSVCASATDSTNRHNETNTHTHTHTTLEDSHETTPEASAG